MDVPRTRIFTINSNSEVSLDLLSLNKLKMTYVNINEVVDHYFPPVDTLVRGGGEEYTDFMYWRDDPLQMDDFSASDSDDDEDEDDQGSTYSDEEEEEEEAGEGLADSYLSHDEYDDDDEVDEGRLMDSVMQSIETEDADDEENYEEDEDEDAEASGDDEDETRVVEDVSAEIISGVGHLSVEEKVEN